MAFQSEHQAGLSRHHNKTSALQNVSGCTLLHSNNNVTHRIVLKRTHIQEQLIEYVFMYQ